MTSEAALAELLRHLKAAHYHFTAITPASHARVLARPPSGQPNLRDIFGWNRPFVENDVSATLIDLLHAADAVEGRSGQLLSKVRVASLGADLVLHGPFPTGQVDSVFFGPDTYRFAQFLHQQGPRLAAARRLADMGAGSGAGAIVCARLIEFEKITMVDVNPAALRLAAINAAVAGVQAQTLVSDAVPTGADLVIANPPYIMDAAGRAYRDGGDMLGGGIAFEWVRQALDGRLAAGGAMLLYTGVAYVDGEAPLLTALQNLCATAQASLCVKEIDPDVFGEELEQPQYAAVERIAAIGAVICARQ